MPNTIDFWNVFNSEAAPKLALREKTFRKIFETLDLIEMPITIVETGCARLAGNWAGDGQSTVLFDRYISARESESICYTVDINAISVAECRKRVSARIQITQDDSAHYLSGLAREFCRAGWLPNTRRQQVRGFYSQITRQVGRDFSLLMDAGTVTTR